MVIIMIVSTPPMGFNTWNTFGTNISADLVKETADAMVDEGLLDAGYKYLVIDDGWSEPERDPVTDRLVPDHNKFPLGMKDVADYVHAKGLKFGMYSACGIRTCANLPGSFDHEFLDAEMFAEIGIDYLKYDTCMNTKFVNKQVLFRRIGLALRATGRDIVYAACYPGESTKWIRATGAHMYRSTVDIMDNFESVRLGVEGQHTEFGYSAANCFNDMDMLTIGMYGQGNVGSTGQTDEEYLTQFAAWCLLGTPLMIGCDIRHLTPAAKKILTNKELIAIDQDPECRGVYEATPHEWDEHRKVFIRHLSDGTYAVGFFNLGWTDGTVPLYAYNVGITPNSGYGIYLTDLFTGEEYPPFKDYFEVTLTTKRCRMFRARIAKI